MKILHGVAYWGDFAPTLLAAIRNQLLVALLPKYDVRMEEYLSVHSDADAAATEVVTEEMEYPELEQTRARRITIIHNDDEQVVTVMELLSPANKSQGAGGIETYLLKREEILNSQCNLVELDLLRGGRRLPMRDPLPPGDYYAYIGRTERRPKCEVVAWPLASALPSIPIPLLPEDGEIQLDLAAAFKTAYEPALYERRLPYDKPLNPSLDDRTQTWATELLHGAGARATQS